MPMQSRNFYKIQVLVEHKSVDKSKNICFFLVSSSAVNQLFPMRINQPQKNPLPNRTIHS